MGRLQEGLWAGVFLPEEEEEEGYLLSRVSLDSGYRHSLEFLSTDSWDSLKLGAYRLLEFDL